MSEFFHGVLAGVLLALTLYAVFRATVFVTEALHGTKRVVVWIDQEGSNGDK